MKIFDCTTFYDEKLMMDVRFNILDNFVSKFIVVESVFSHSGKKKNLNFDINDYPKFKDKIHYVVIEKEPIGLLEESENCLMNKRINSIKRIEQSYNFMSKGISDAAENDLIMLSDNDEIPKLSSVNLNLLNNDYLLFKQYFLYYKFNLLYDRMYWFGTKACKKKNLKSFSSLRNIKNKKYSFWRLDTYLSEIKQINLRIIDDGGWHFTNLKTPAELFKKLSNFGHHDEFSVSSLTEEDLKQKIENKEVFYDHLADKSSNSKWNISYKLKKIDENLLPSYIVQNRENLKKWFD